MASGVKIDGVSDLNLIYEFAGRTATMAIVSIIIMFSQNLKLFMVMFLINLLWEIQESIIDPLFPITNAPLSPTGDLIAHIVIVGIELITFIKKNMSKELRINDSEIQTGWIVIPSTDLIPCSKSYFFLNVILFEKL